MPEPTTARAIIARVCNEHRNSDLRADDRDVLAAIDATLAELRTRITKLQETNNTYMEKARRFEAEANQQFSDTILHRNECIRLRGHMETLSSFIEECHANSGEPIPEEIAAAIDAVFPPDAKGDAEQMRTALGTVREFVADELEARRKSFLPISINGDGHYIQSAETALAAIDSVFTPATPEATA